MRQRVQDLIRVGDRLFANRFPLLSLWQVQAENFHVMRADFTRTRYISEEFGSYLMTGRPARAHRDLKNAFAAMLRRDQWFHARTDSETVNNDRSAKEWLDWASKTMRLAMYDRRANFVRATKEGDGDFCCFGNAVITRELCDYEHMLYRCWHLRDVAWDESVTGLINAVHFDWRPQARQLQEQAAKSKGKFQLSPKVAELKNEEAFKEIKCRRILLPVDEYDLPAQQTRGMKFVSVYVDVENQVILEETPQRSLGTTIPRWEFGGRMFGGQYGYSPAVVYGLPDARMMQQMMLSMLTASELATFPPMIAVGEAINGAVNYYASGITQVDADYDERMGDVLRPFTQNFEGIRYGAEQLERLENALDDSFYLSKIRFPQITKEMTAFEASKLWEDFIRESLPLFEPVQVEYNQAICDGSFEDLLSIGTFGSVEDMPQILRGRDIVWQFDTPITVAAERALKASFDIMVDSVVKGAQIDPSVGLLPDMPVATRQTIDGAGAPAKWLKSEERFAADRQQKAQQEAAAAAADQLARGADVGSQLANAVENVGNAHKVLQETGVA